MFVVVYDDGVVFVMIEGVEYCFDVVVGDYGIEVWGCDWYWVIDVIFDLFFWYYVVMVEFELCF